MSNEKYSPVKAIQFYSSHWYVLPVELIHEFYKDEQDEEFVDSGQFDTKYGQYRTGGDLNLTQLYVKEDENN